MFHVVLHVHMTASKNFKTEGTEQLFSVFMDCPEMCLHIREKRRSVIAHLQGWNESQLVSVAALIASWHKDTTQYEVCFSMWHLAHVRHFSGFVIFLHVLQEALLGSESQFTYLTIGWKREEKFHIRFWLSCLNLWTLFRSYLRIRFGCERSRCGTAAGMESCTDDSNAGRSCGSPNSHCSASPAPNGASYGS